MTGFNNSLYKYKIDGRTTNKKYVKLTFESKLQYNGRGLNTVQ